MQPEERVWRKSIRRETRGRKRVRVPQATPGRAKMPTARMVHEIYRDESLAALQRVYRLIPPRPDCTYVLASTVPLETYAIRAETLVFAYDGATYDAGSPVWRHDHMQPVDGWLSHAQWQAIEAMGYMRAGLHESIAEVARFIRSC